MPPADMMLLWEGEVVGSERAAFAEHGGLCSSLGRHHLVNHRFLHFTISSWRAGLAARPPYGPGTPPKFIERINEHRTLGSRALCGDSGNGLVSASMRGKARGQKERRS